MWHRRGALLHFKVICQISTSHGTNNRQFWPKLGIYGLHPQFEFTDGYKMMHRASHNIKEMPYCCSRSSVKCQGHAGQNVYFDSNWVFPDCNASLVHGLLWNDEHTNAFSLIIWGLCCQKQVSQAGISNYTSQFTVRCNYLSLPGIPASGHKVHISYIWM